MAFGLTGTGRRPMTSAVPRTIARFDPRLLWAAGGFALLVLVAAVYRLDEAVDFIPVWNATHAFLHGGNPYTVDAYVYPPSTLLLAAPLGLVSFDTARLILVVADAALTVLACVWCLRLLSIPWRSLAGGLAFIAVALYAPVGSTLHLGNVNGIVVVGEVGFLLAASRGRWNGAGWFLGATLAVKPVLLPLVVVPLLWRQWGAAVRAVGFAGVLSALGLAVSSHPGDFFSTTVPYILNTNADRFSDYNVSLKGAVEAVGMSSGVGAVLRLLVAAACVELVRRRLRRGALDDQVGRLVDVSGIILLGTFLCFSFSWSLYGIYLIPLLLATAVGRSCMRRWGLWGALLLVGSPDVWLWTRSGDLPILRITGGLLLMLAAIASGLRATEERAAPARTAPATAA